MDDRSFYQRRLTEELARASSEKDEAMKSLHRHWADLYKERLRNLPRPLLAA